MRRLLIPLLLSVPALALAADAVTFEARSQKYSLQVDVIPSGDTTQYAARVIDLATGRVLAAPKVDLDAESITDVGDLTLRVRVRSIVNGISGTLLVEQGDALVDDIESRWALKPGRLRVGGDVKAPVVVSKVEPVYPEEARRARISGIVILEATIDKTGVVRDVQVLKPLPSGLSEAAADAVRQWTFQPATRKGQPVDVVFNLTINFKLDVAPRAPAQ